MGFYIQNANLNENSEVYIRTLYLYNEYLPVEYDTQRILFTNINRPIWLLFRIDFFDFNINGNNINIKYFKRTKEQDQLQEFNKEFVKKRNKYQSRGGIILCNPNENKVFNSELNECIDSTTTPQITIQSGIIEYNNNYIQCDSNKFLSFSNIRNS